MKLVKLGNTRRLFFTTLIALSLGACSDSQQNADEANDQSNSVESQLADKNKHAKTNPIQILPKDSFKTVEWIDLMPQDDLDALSNPPAYLSEIEDGSPEDQINSHLQSTISASTDDRYQQALVSTKVVEEMDGQAVKIPGFIVPVEFNDDQIVTSFFLVPFFGACIHVPPPPPNQIIFVEYPKGLKLESLYDPFWIYGVLETSLVENDIARSSYSLSLHHYEKYYDY